MAPADLDAPKLLSLHKLTRDVGQFCLPRLRAHLEALSPLFRPRRFLGDHMEGAGREGALEADKNAAELAELYRRVAVKPFDLRPELSSPIESVSTQFHLHEWEYLHPTQTDRGWHSIRVTTPLTWVLTYASPYSLSTLREVTDGKAQRDTEAVRAFVLRACVMHELFRKTPSLNELLTGLRYRVDIRKSPSFGDLPLVTIAAPFQTFRPADDLVALAGGQTFAEVLDVDSVRNLPDPIRDETLRMLQQHKLEL